MTLLSTRTAARLGVAGGIVLAVYASLKPLFGTPGGWVLPFVPAASSWKVYHLLETVPVLLVAAGVYGLYRYQQPDGLAGARGGFLFSLVACGSAIVAHGLEHLTPAIPVPVPFFGDGNVWMWAYYGSWFSIALGLSIVGSTSARTGVVDRPVRTIVAWTLPIAFGLAILVKLATGSGFELGFALAVALSAFLGSWRLASSGLPNRGAEGTRIADDRPG